MGMNESPKRSRQRPGDILTPEQKAEQTAGLRRRLAEDRQRTPEQRAEEASRLLSETAEARRKHPQAVTSAPQRKDSLWTELTAGVINAQIVCPQCQRSGSVRTKKTRQKVGVSGGKATGALLTGGLSLLATGLSRKQQVTQAHCGNCGSDWTF